MTFSVSKPDNYSRVFNFFLTITLFICSDPMYRQQCKPQYTVTNDNPAGIREVGQRCTTLRVRGTRTTTMPSHFLSQPARVEPSFCWQTWEVSLNFHNVLLFFILVSLFWRWLHSLLDIKVVLERFFCWSFIWGFYYSYLKLTNLILS